MSGMRPLRQPMVRNVIAHLCVLDYTPCKGSSNEGVFSTSVTPKRAFSHEAG